jgi:hypothetical protein
VIVFFNWSLRWLPIHGRKPGPHYQHRPQQTTKVVLNLVVDKPQWLTRYLQYYAQRPELVILFHARPPRPWNQYIPDSHPSTNYELECLVRACEQRSAGILIMRPLSLIPSANRITFVNSQALPNPPPTSDILEIRCLTFDEYRAEVGDQQFHLETDDEYVLPAQLKRRLRAVADDEASGTEMP